MRRLFQAITLAGAAALAASAIGQDSAEECAAIEDDRERLACFDAVFRGSDADADAPATLPGIRRPADPPAQPAVRTPPPTPPPAARAPDPEEEFGFDGSPRRTAGAKSIRSVARGSFESWQRGMDIELDNGQVWRVVSDRPLFFKTANPEVEINRGLLGAFYLGFGEIHQRLKVVRIR